MRVPNLDGVIKVANPFELPEASDIRRLPNTHKMATVTNILLRELIATPPAPFPGTARCAGNNDVHLISPYRTRNTSEHEFLIFDGAKNRNPFRVLPGASDVRRPPTHKSLRQLQISCCASYQRQLYYYSALTVTVVHTSDRL